jgi:hypothetical protein
VRLLIQGKQWAAIPDSWRVVVGGFSCLTWISLWRHCHNKGFVGPELREWPDGKSLMEQPKITVRMFELITEQQNLEAHQLAQVKTNG